MSDRALRREARWSESVLPAAYCIGDSRSRGASPPPSCPDDPTGFSIEKLGIWACDALAREDNNRGHRSSARDIATATLLLEHVFGVTRDRALTIASESMWMSRRSSLASTKKNKSEARAILEFGQVVDETDSGPPSGDPFAILCHLTAKLGTVRLAAIRRLRAQRLAGTKGGRPEVGSMRVLAQVLRLRADASKASELEAIRLELLA